MRLPRLNDRGWLKHPLLLQAARIEQRFGPFAQRAPQPLADRYAEAHLRAFDQRARDMAEENLAQHPFRGAIA